MASLFSRILLLAGAAMVLTPVCSLAQARLYLDLQLGANYTHAEGAYFGKETPPFKAYDPRQSFDEQGVVRLRLQANEKFGVSVGYNGSTLGWGYHLKVPNTNSYNPFGGGQFHKSTGRYIHQFPLLFTRTIGRYNIKEIDAERHLYLMSFRLDAVFGGGLNRMKNKYGYGSFGSGAGLYDTVQFKQTIIRRRTWGGFFIGGVTARFYRLGKERLNLSLYYTQGLTDMVLVPVTYRYNAQRGSTTLHVRGSGFSATLGVPLCLVTFKKNRLHY